MAIIKCKMCGGDVELAADKTFGTCEYCGSSMTFPKVDDDQRAAAFNRGNHFRRIGEFDKALAVYERIVREDDTDAEAHWCCALCRFGIEYVEDPTTYEYLPTCHRASFDSFLEDVDYLAAVEHSEGITKQHYQKDAAKIAEVQRGILATSQNEEPFDVFICYKESDDNGERTRDSLLAQDIYYQLTDHGYRVFFARITLEDMVGKQYEPCIFAALNSAKVMIVIGTKPEYMSAVWVKNEWSRFLAMMKKDHSKLLLPCYRDMDPYDMPKQLSILQSYDMSKIGFIQDLIRGIKKVLDANKKVDVVQETVVVQRRNSGTAPLKRGLTIAVVTLLLAVIAIVLYSIIRIFSVGLFDFTDKKQISRPSITDPSITNPSTTNPSTTSPSTTSPSTTSPSTNNPDDIPCTGLTINGPTPIELREGYQLSVTVLPADTTDEITFVSADESIVKVTKISNETKDCVITAVGAGKTTITVICGSIEVECQVICNKEEATGPSDPTEPIDPTEPTDPVDPTEPSEPAEEFSINADDFSLFYIGESWNIYDGSDPEKIIWSSDNPSVATIENGKVVAVGPGVTTVYGEYNGIKLSCIVRCIFTVSESSEPGV